MASDIKRYGTSELGGAFYFVRETPGMYGGQTAATYHIDGLGDAVKVGKAGDEWTPEQIAELPTLEEAIARHLAPAFEEAEANQKAWLRQREDVPEPEPKPAPMDLATSRFLGDA